MMMKSRRACLVLALFATVVATSPQALSAREIVDSAGRMVGIPDHVTRVMAAGPPASVLMAILAPQMLIGWQLPPAPAALPYLPAATRALPVVGRLTGRGSTANLETIIGAKPDLIVDFGTISQTYISLADRTQAQTGIPYLLIDGRFAHTVAALTLLGSVLNVTERARTLVAKIQSVFDAGDAVLRTIPDQQRPRVYLARRDNGLETSYRGSLNTEIIERAGGINVVDTGPLQGGLVNVSLEQVLAWNPDTIITTDPAFAKQAPTAAGWRDIDAVKKQRVFVSPSLPYGWIDAPPSLNRMIGLVWLEHVFFPSRFPADLRTQTREFYKLFYQVDLSDAQLDALLPHKGATP